MNMFLAILLVNLFIKKLKINLYTKFNIFKIFIT